MENNYKSPEQLLRELLEARGYTTTPADGWTPYTAISADGVTIWAGRRPAWRMSASNSASSKTA